MAKKKTSDKEENIIEVPENALFMDVDDLPPDVLNGLLTHKAVKNIIEGNAQKTQPAKEKAPENSPQGIRQRIDTLAFLMDLAKNPDDTMLAYKEPFASVEAYQKYTKDKFNLFVNLIAKKTGDDPEQIKDPDRRTPEQNLMLLSLSAHEQVNRINAFFSSNYYHATQAIEPLKGRYADTEPEDDYTIKEYAVLYFFANHYPDVKPQKKNDLTAEQINEIKENFVKLDAFYYEQTDGGQKERNKEIFIDFLRQENADPAQILKLLPRVTSTPILDITRTTDKINYKIWDDLSNLPKNNNGQIAFSTEKENSKRPATVLFSINFEELDKIDGLKLSKTLNVFDKWVYTAVSACFNQNGDYMSTGQIFNAMGGKGKPAASQIKKINDSLTKMGATRIYIDNLLETPVNKNYPQFNYDGALLPFERVSVYINNNLVENAIHVFREPPLMDFARKRKQITTIPRKLLDIPLSQTEDNLQIEDYLLDRIAGMKNKKALSRKILLSSLFEKCKIDGKSGKDKMARSRAPEKIIKCLDHFVEQKYIKGYTTETDAFTIIL